MENIKDLNGIQLRLSRVKAHSPLGIGEGINSPLRRTYNKAVHTSPNSSKQVVLKVAVKAMKDSMVEHALLHSRLVFGIIPIFPILNTDSPNHTWKGPFIVVDYTGRQVSIRTLDETKREMYSAYQSTSY